ncbi:MAG: hypothetical protein IJ906_05420, partial [Oscillospiraceae bacterium]|nr:hypothetical protein [Oscillospiraceae bacterium]
MAEQDSEARKAWNKEDHYKSLGDRISDIVLGSTEQSIGQYGKFIPEVMAQASEGKAGRSGTVAHRGGMDFRDRANPNHVDKLQAEADRIRKQQYLGSVGAGQAASKLIAKGTEKAEQGMQGLSGGGKFAAETLQGATQLAIDLGIGATGLGMVPMGLRAAGGEVDTAMKSGATRKQALASGVAAGGIEMLTERIGNMGAILQKGFGKGISDDVVDRLLGKIAQKAASQGLKDLTHVSGRWLAAAAEEGLEEVIAEAVEPGLANAIYDAGNATILSDPEQALADWAHAGALGAVLGGVAGGGGVVAQHRTGSNIRRAGMVDDMMARAVNVDDEADAATAQGLKAVVDSGQPLTSLQVEKLSSIVSKQQRANNEKMDDAVRAATTVMARHGYSAPQDDDIRIQRGEDVVYATENLISAQSWGDDTAAVRQRSGEIADRMARLETGEFSNADVDTILSDPVQRTIYEQVTGVELPKAPSEARNAIYVRAADGLVAMAQTQTELDRNDAYQKLVKKKEGSFGAQGQGVHNRLFADLESRGVDSRDNDAVSDLEKAFEIMYNGGKNDYKFSELRNMFRDDPRFQNADVEFLNAAYNAGQADGKAQVRAAARRQAGILKADGNTKGRLITTNLSEENTPSIELRLTLESIARMTGNDIVLEDKLDNDVEGFYDNREIHIAANVKRPILSILTHEITHFIEDFAPEAWADLRDYAVSHADELYGVDINTLIENKIKQYANAGVKLDREGAIKEIIANTPKLYTDGSIIEDIVNANRPLGVRILMGIREALRKIRAAIAENSAADTRWLRADIEAVKEAERLWTDALAKAAENRGAAAEDNGERLSAAVNPLFISNNEMNANLHDVHGMSPVGEVAFNVDSVVTKNMSENVDAAYNYLLENGGVSFERNDVGGIDVTASGLGDVLRHGNARFKMSIMGIIPHVLTGGKIVAADQNHRGRGYNTVTLSAPVTLTGRGYGKYDEPGTYYAAVVLSRKYAKNGFISQKLHVTDVLIEKKDSRNMVQSAQVGTLSDAENLNLRDILRHVDADVNIFAEDSEQRQYSIASDEDYVTLTPERIDSIISEYAIPGNTSSDYSKAWIATINPRDFLTLTVSSDVEARWPEAELDNEELKKTRQMPYLTIDSSESNSVIGHEGRHRMLAMVNAGITESPVIIKDISESTKNNKQPMDTMDLWSQDFGSGPVNDTNEGMGADVDVYDLIPVNEKNRAEIERLYGGNTRVQFSIEEPVETSGDLIAVHNLYEDDIKNALELGGFPMPSIAVTNMPHDKYGDISLLFG